MSGGADELLATARARLPRRYTPTEAHADPDLLIVDIRSETQRAADGTIPGAPFIARNVLEWRLDPTSPHRDAKVARPGARIALICDEGYQSTLAAAGMQGYDLAEITDVAGGFQAWREAGLPVAPLPPQARG